eukprot:13190914-Alexandrium_andersonii.AAC.1
MKLDEWLNAWAMASESEPRTRPLGGCGSRSPGTGEPSPEPRRRQGGPARRPRRTWSPSGWPWRTLAPPTAKRFGARKQNPGGH